MNLHQLRYFIAVAEEGHITRAAERLGIQQPPLSRIIKGIEQELDVQLLRRKARGVELTDAGRAFLDRARAALANIDQAIVTARRTARGEQGHICVGVAHAAAHHPFAPLAIRAFREALPLVSVTLEETTSDSLIQHLRNERMDTAFIRWLPADSTGLLINKLLDEEVIVALPSGHPLALAKGNRNAALPLKALSSESFIMMRPQSSAALHATTIAACHSAGFAPKVAQEVPRATSSLGYVAAGLGISFVPASLQRMQMQGVSFRRVTSPVQPTVPLVLACRRGDPSPVVRQFVNLVRRAAKDFPAA